MNKPTLCVQLLERTDEIEREKNRLEDLRVCSSHCQPDWIVDLYIMQAKHEAIAAAREHLNQINADHQRKLEEQRREQEMLQRVQLEQKMKARRSKGQPFAGHTNCS